VAQAKRRCGMGQPTSFGTLQPPVSGQCEPRCLGNAKYDACIAQDQFHRFYGIFGDIVSCATDTYPRFFDFPTAMVWRNDVAMETVATSHEQLMGYPVSEFFHKKRLKCHFF